MKVDFGTFYFGIVTAVLITYLVTKFGINGLFDMNVKPFKWFERLVTTLFE
ncbi:hypothetical protein [Companilactobacillus nodensis]|uniref:Uncharacterized protein n=1 Tax=Companilactobacillus nodensis DSM 19682 = JCM 14932 = NBRC 107160 TaxID=1423775 RepID=A0A0R1K7S4_9LACO|nr:hypothetical protein [Companilactobacillus nodensis]KRK79484.1 hypothetical protein FD03_GL000616 [Companilactobacillus nodensis DSM 19682 = JCM 14932 = NBRC 107160]